MHCCNFKLYIKKFNTKQQGFFPSAKFSLISKFLNGVHDVAWVKNASITRIHFVPSNPFIFPYCVPSRQTGVSAKIYPASAQMHNKQTHQHNATMAFPYTYKKQHTHTRPALTHIFTASICRTRQAASAQSWIFNRLLSTHAPYMSPSSSAGRRSPLKWEYYHSRRLSLPVLRWNLWLYVCARMCSLASPLM